MSVRCQNCASAHTRLVTNKVRFNTSADILKVFAIFCIAVPVAYLAHGIGEIVPPEFVFLVAGLSFSIVGFVRRSSRSVQ